MECNITSVEGDIDIDDELRKKLDILLVGFSHDGNAKIIKGYSCDLWKTLYVKIFTASKEKVLESNTNMMIKAIRKIILI